jgi:SNF2 family DNA or RNA helicase
MTLEIDGWTILFYDKFAGAHNYNNKFTTSVKLKDLFSSDCAQLSGTDAIDEFNKFGSDNIPLDLDSNLYRVTIFITSYGENVDNVAKYTCVGVNNEMLKKCVLAGNVPNVQFLIRLCRHHNSYNKSSNCDDFDKYRKYHKYSNVQVQAIIDKVKSTVGDIVDPMIANPDFLACQLYDYQKRSIYWMQEREKNPKKIMYNINDEVVIGEVFFDAMQQKFTLGTERNVIIFQGGALIDEVGLGKTVQMTALSLLNPANDVSYIREGINKLCSRASLIICPNQLCGQWKRELEKMVKSEHNIKIVPMLTKVHFDKCTYQDLLDADFVIASLNFFDNKSFLSKIYNDTSKNKTVPFDIMFDKLGKELVADASSIFKTNPLIPLIKWNRVIIDEFHELYTVDKYQYMKNFLPVIEGNYRWCVTGTPFDKSSECMLRMLDYVTNYANHYGDRILNVNSIAEHMQAGFFRRNTKKSVMAEYQLPPIKESIVWLRFSHTERMMYNAYLANPDNDKYSIFLRQLCCHPKLAEETKDLLSNCKTLEDVEKMMVLHYERTMKKSEGLVNLLNKRIEFIKMKIKRVEYRRQKRFLIQIGYDASIDENDLGLENIDVNITDDADDAFINVDDIDDVDDNDDKKHVPKGPKIVVSDENQDQIHKLIGHLLEKNPSKTIGKYTEYLGMTAYKLRDAQAKFEGSKTTYDFYKNVFDRIKKTTKDGKKSDDEQDDETCGICLSEIPEDDIGVTKCGHIFCYQCIKTIIADRHECPYCRKKVNGTEIFMISYEKKKDARNEETKEFKDKLSLVNEVGTKLANIICYLKNQENHVIIFSQWDDMLRKIGAILDSYGIKNIFCKGSVWQRDKAIRTFNSDPNMRIIMLSSENSVSGTNLTKANKIIIVDPVCGSYEHRKNTEGQAIGRAHRMGQKSEVEVIRFIIKDTIEEEIYKENNEEDKKHIANMKIFESTDEAIVLSSDKINELNTSYNESKNKKHDPAKKKIVVKAVKPKSPVKKRVMADSDNDHVPNPKRRPIRKVLSDSDSDNLE